MGSKEEKNFILEEKVRDIIIGLKDGSDEIRNVLIIGEGIYVRSSDTNMSKVEVAFLANLRSAIEISEHAMEEIDSNCKKLVIESSKFNIIVKRAGSLVVAVQVTEIVPTNYIGLLTESGPAGTIKHIDDAVEEIKAVLSKQ